MSVARCLACLVVVAWGNGASMFADESLLVADRPEAVFQHGTYVHSAVISRDGKLLATASNDRHVRLWDVSTHKELFALETPRDTVKALAISPDGKWIAAGGERTLVYLWSTADGKLAQRFEGHQDEVNALAFSPDGKLLATGGNDRLLITWNLATGKQANRATAASAVQCLAFFPDASVLAAGGSRAIQLWNAADLNERGFIGKRNCNVKALAVSPDGRTMAVVAFGSLLLWNALTDREIGTLPGHRSNRADGTLCLGFSRDGKYLYSGGQDRLVRLWEIATRREIAQWEGHANWVGALAVADPPGVLATADFGKTARLWKAVPLDVGKPPTDAELKGLCADLAGRDAAKAFRAACRLVRNPDQTIAALGEYLNKAPASKVPNVAQLIADLDDDDQAVRNRASEELERLGELAEPAVFEALARKQPSLELRRRLERIAERLGGPLENEEALRAVRGVAVLERIATPAAKLLLAKLAKDDDRPWAALEARAALARLGDGAPEEDKQ